MQGHWTQYGSWPSKNYQNQVCFKLAYWSKRSFPILSYALQCPLMEAMIRGLDQWTNFRTKNLHALLALNLTLKEDNQRTIPPIESLVQNSQAVSGDLI